MLQADWQGVFLECCYLNTEKSNSPSPKSDDDCIWCIYLLVVSRGLIAVQTIIAFKNDPTDGVRMTLGLFRSEGNGDREIPNSVFILFITDKD